MSTTTTTPATTTTATLKTPEQITEAAAEAMVREHELMRVAGESARNSLAWELVSGDTLIVEHALEELVRRAIEADRAQRDLYELIAEALEGRADWDEGDGENAQRAADLLRAGTEDCIWDRYVGPMLDDLMRHLGAPDDKPMKTPEQEAAR